jgi:hypothetical protein
LTPRDVGIVTGVEEGTVRCGGDARAAQGEKKRCDEELQEQTHASWREEHGVEA